MLEVIFQIAFHSFHHLPLAALAPSALAQQQTTSCFCAVKQSNRFLAKLDVVEHKSKNA